MGEEFIRSAGQEYDAEIATETLQVLIEGDTSVVLVNDDCTAMIGGLTYRHFFNTERVASEVFWWAKSGGMELLKAFEAWAKEQGASRVMMVCLHALEPERVARIYARRGYEPLEHSFVRRI
jgi:GNAT superfamily N-acetyltransferase